MESLDVKKLEVENLRVAKTRPATEPDQVDVALEVWARELPDLDLDRTEASPGSSPSTSACPRAR